MLPRAGELSKKGSRGSWPLALHCTFPAGQVASKISRFSTFAQLKRRKNSEGFLKSIAEAGRQDPINWGSSIFPIHQHAGEVVLAMSL